MSDPENTAAGGKARTGAGAKTAAGSPAGRAASARGRSAKGARGKTATATSAVSATTVSATAGADPRPVGRYEDMIGRSKESLDAVVVAGNAMIGAGREISAGLVDFARISMAENLEASRRIMGAGSIGEAFERQAALGRDNMEKLIAEGGRVAEIYARALEAAFAPLSGKAAAASIRAMKPAG